MGGGKGGFMGSKCMWRGGGSLGEGEAGGGRGGLRGKWVWCGGSQGGGEAGAGPTHHREGCEERRRCGSGVEGRGRWRRVQGLG